MAWEIEYTGEFETWWNDLNEEEQVDITAVVDVLAERGPGLRRPLVGVIDDSKHPNMKELIVQHAGRPYRVFFIFDPRRTAILLIGGDKTGNPRFYEEYIPKADKIYDDYLRELEKEKEKDEGKSNGKKLQRATKQNVARGSGAGKGKDSDHT